MPPLRTDLQAAPSVYAQTHAPLPTQSKSASHWPHSGPPDWHPPRPSPSPPPQRSPTETTELKKQLYDIFPDQKQRIDRILNDNPYMRDLNALSGLLLGWTHDCWAHLHKHTKQCFMSLWLQNNSEHDFNFFYTKTLWSKDCCKRVVCCRESCSLYYFAFKITESLPCSYKHN